MLDERIARAIPKPERAPVRESIAAVVLRELAALDRLQLETLYTNPTTPPEIIACIEMMPARIDGTSAAPRLRAETRERRAWIDATDEQRAKAEGLQQIRAGILGCCGIVRAALKHVGA